MKLIIDDIHKTPIEGTWKLLFQSIFLVVKFHYKNLQDVLDQTLIFLQNHDGHVLGLNETSFFNQIVLHHVAIVHQYL